MIHEPYIKVDDKHRGVMHQAMCFEDGEVDIEISHTKSEGFSLSVLNIKTKKMTFYSVIDGVVKLNGAEDIETGESMLRDDISTRVCELLQAEYEWIEDEVKENSLFVDLGIETQDAVDFVTTLLKEFDLEEVAFAHCKSWSSVNCIVNYIENALEERL